MRAYYFTRAEGKKKPLRTVRKHLSRACRADSAPTRLYSVVFSIVQTMARKSCAPRGNVGRGNTHAHVRPLQARDQTSLKAQRGRSGYYASLPLSVNVFSLCTVTFAACQRSDGAQTSSRPAGRLAGLAVDVRETAGRPSPTSRDRFTDLRRRSRASYIRYHTAAYSCSRR